MDLGMPAKVNPCAARITNMEAIIAQKTASAVLARSSILKYAQSPEYSRKR